MRPLSKWRIVPPTPEIHANNVPLVKCHCSIYQLGGPWSLPWEEDHTKLPLHQIGARHSSDTLMVKQTRQRKSHVSVLRGGDGGGSRSHMEMSSGDTKPMAPFFLWKSGRLVLRCSAYISSVTNLIAGAMPCASGCILAQQLYMNRYQLNILTIASVTNKDRMATTV